MPGAYPPWQAMPNVSWLSAIEMRFGIEESPEFLESKEKNRPAPLIDVVKNHGREVFLAIVMIALFCHTVLRCAATWFRNRPMQLDQPGSAGLIKLHRRTPTNCGTTHQWRVASHTNWRTIFTCGPRQLVGSGRRRIFLTTARCTCSDLWLSGKWSRSRRGSRTPRASLWRSCRRLPRLGSPPTAGHGAIPRLGGPLGHHRHRFAEAALARVLRRPGPPLRPTGAQPL